MPKSRDELDKNQKIMEVAIDLAHGNASSLAQDLRRTYPGDRGESLARDVEAKAAWAATEFEPLRLRLAEAGVAVPSLMALRLDPPAVRRGLSVLVQALSGPLPDSFLAGLVALLSDARVSPTNGRVAAGRFAIGELLSPRVMSVPLEERLGDAVRRTARLHPLSALVDVVVAGHRVKATPYVLAGLASFRGARRLELLTNPTVQQRRDLFGLALKL